MVSPRRVVRGLGATPKRRSAGLLMARCWEPKSEVGVARRFRERDSGVGFTGGKLCLTVSALCIMWDQDSPPLDKRGMDESRIGMKVSRMGLKRGGLRGAQSHEDRAFGQSPALRRT